MLLVGLAEFGDAEGVAVEPVAQGVAQPFAFVGEDELLDPAVFGVGLAGDQAAALEPVDEPGDIRRVVGHAGGQLSHGGGGLQGDQGAQLPG